MARPAASTLLPLLLAGTATVCLAQCEPGEYHGGSGCVLCPAGRYHAGLGAPTCTETATTSVADDATACAAVTGTDLDSATACEAVMTADTGDAAGAAACTYSPGSGTLWGTNNPGAGGLCEGDCDDDAECAGDLQCWQRSTRDVPVPGCIESAVSAANSELYDYCYDPADRIMESDCISCEAGQYGTEARTSCQACDAGRYSSQPEARSASYCLTCEPGQYSSLTRTSCEICGPGSFTAESDGDLDGTGVFTGAGACNECPAETYRGSENMCGPATDSGVCTQPQFRREQDCTDNGGAWTPVVDGLPPQILNCLAGIGTPGPATASVRVSVRTALAGAELSWNVDSGSVAAGSSYSDDGEFHTIVELAVGAHTLHLFDSGGDGWGDSAFWSISDASTEPPPLQCLAHCRSGDNSNPDPCGDGTSSGCCDGHGSATYVPSQHGCVCAVEVCSDPSISTEWYVGSVLAGGLIEGRVEGQGDSFPFLLTQDGQICHSWAECPSVGQDVAPATGWDAREGAAPYETCTGASVAYTTAFTSADGPPSTLTEHADECAAAVIAANGGAASACADSDADGFPDCYTPPFSPAEQAARVRWSTTEPTDAEIKHCYRITDFFRRADCTHTPEGNPLVGTIADDETEQCIASTWLENEFVCTLGLACNAHQHGTEGVDFGYYPYVEVPVETGQNAAFEWSGMFPLDGATSPCKWHMQAGADGTYPDQSMILVIIPTSAEGVATAAAAEATMTSLESDAADLLGTSCTAVADAGSMTPPTGGACYTLNVGTGVDSEFDIVTTGLAGVAVFAQHIPIEFERDRHYFTDGAGIDLEPIVESAHDVAHSGQTCTCMSDDAVPSDWLWVVEPGIPSDCSLQVRGRGICYVNADTCPDAIEIYPPTLWQTYFDSRTPLVSFQACGYRALPTCDECTAMCAADPNCAAVDCFANTSAEPWDSCRWFANAQCDEEGMRLCQKGSYHACDGQTRADYGAAHSYIDDTTGAQVECGEAPIVEIVVDSGDLLRPPDYDGPMRVDATMVSPRTCQELCTASPECTHFSYATSSRNEREMRATSWCYLEADYADPLCTASGYVTSSSARARFICTSSGEEISSRLVNDGDANCLDGSDEADCVDESVCVDDYIWRYSDRGNDYDCAAFAADPGLGVEVCDESWAAGVDSNGDTVTAYEACPVSCPVAASSSRGEHACGGQIGMDYGGNPTYTDSAGNEVSCGYAPWVRFISNSAEWSPPTYGQDSPVSVDESMESPLDCQVLCHNDPDCEYFSYEWELTSLAPPPPPASLAPRLGVEYGGYTYSTIMPTNPDSESPLLCHGSSTWLPVPAGYEIAPDTADVIDNVVAPHPWSTHVMVLASLRGYGTSAFNTGVEYGDHQDKAVSRIRDGEEQWSCPWSCYQILVRIPTSQAVPVTTTTAGPAPPPLAATMIHKCYMKRPYDDANCNAAAFTPWSVGDRPDLEPTAATVSMAGVSRSVEVRIQGGGSRGVLEMNIDGDCEISVGVSVQVRDTIGTPYYGWGGISHGDCGTVTYIESAWIGIDFGGLGTWYFQEDEMEPCGGCSGWDAVCDDGFGAAEADAVCRQLGWMAGGSSYDTTHGDSTFAMDNLDCPSGAQDLSDCSTFMAPYTDDCGDYETVGIQCGEVGGEMDEVHGHRESGSGIPCSLSGETCTPPSLVDNGPDACVAPVYLSDAGTLDQSCGYSDNQVCTYHLTCSTGNPILTFLSFNTEANFDYVNVYDGADDTAPRVLRKDGTAIPSPVIGSGAQVTVELTTDYTITSSGYTAEFTCGFCQERGRNFIIDETTTVDSDENCDGNLVDAVNPTSPVVASLPDLPNEFNTAAGSIDLSPIGEAVDPSNVEAPFDSVFFETTNFAGAFRATPTRSLCDPSSTCGLFISMAAEGSGLNRFIEIYNPTTESINLDEYGFPHAENGATVDGRHDYWNYFTAGATIAPGDAYVVCHPDAADSLIQSVCDQKDQFLSNGGNGLCLVHGTEDDYQFVDCVGDFDSTDPGSGWDACGVSAATQGHTLVRKCDITFGNAGDWDSTTGTSSEDCQWTVEAEDYWDTAGYHTHVCGSALTDLGHSWLDGWSWLDCVQGTLAGGYRDCIDPNSALPSDFSSTACGEITADVAWSGNVEMTCPVFVKDGAVLTIAPGTTVYAHTVSSGYTAGPCTPADCTPAVHCIYVRNSASCQPLTSVLVIEPGGTINAAGTVTEPITFTVNAEIAEQSAGQWGGIIILGNAPIAGGSRDIEILSESYTYGGQTATDSSGTLQYVRVWYAGASIAAGLQVGMTFGAVGSGTIVENCEVALSADDGFEFLGGTVNAKHLSSIFAGENSFDIEMGYTGKMQFLLGMLGIAGQHGFEVDGNADTTHSAESAPQVMGMTIVGSRDNEAQEALVRLREGTRGAFGNLVLHTRPGGDGIRIEDCYGTPSTQSFLGPLPDGTILTALYVSASTIMYSPYDCPFIPPVVTESGPGIACSANEDDLRWLPDGSRAAVALCEPTRHKCATCGEGHYTTNEAFDRDGRGVETGATECIPCPEGKANELGGDDICEGCGPGMYTGGVSEGCLPCPVGEFNEVSDDSCEECETGTFAAEPGQDICQPCGNRCMGNGACQADGSCVCEPDSGFSGDSCEVFDPCDLVYSTECSEVHPARLCRALSEVDVDCVIAQLVTPAWTDGGSDDSMTPELPAGYPTTPAAEYSTLGGVCEAGLPAVIERTERWLQLAEDYMLQTATDNSKLIAAQICAEKRFATLACLRSPESVGTRAEHRSPATIEADLDRLEQLRTRACDFLGVVEAAHTSGDLLQTTDVQPLSFQQYDATMDKLGDYITTLQGRLEDAATTAVHDLMASEQVSAEHDASEEAEFWQEQVDEDSNSMQSYKTQIQGLHTRIVDTLSALQLSGPELIATAEERNAAARNTFDAALSIAALSVEERATANAKLDTLLQGQGIIQGDLETMRADHAAAQQVLLDELDQMESNNEARHDEVTLQLRVMREEDRAREQRLVGELTRLEEGQRRIEAQLARLPSSFEPSTCTASEQLSTPIANGCGNSINSIYHDLAAQAVQRTSWFGSFVNWAASTATGYSADGADDLRECCNDHDRCYGLCGHTQAFCDSELSTCMQEATSLPVGIVGIDPTLLDVDNILQEFLGCGCYVIAQESYVAESHRGSEAQCADSRLDVILRQADEVCDIVLGVAASFVSGDALELLGVDIVSDETQATIGRTITRLVQPLQDTINAIQDAIRSAFRARCVELTGRRLVESDREAACGDLTPPECDQLMVTLENTQAKIAASRAFVDTAQALFALNMQVLGEEAVDAATVAEVDMRLLDLETLDDAVFVAGFQALISKTGDFADYELDIRQVVSLLRSKMEQMRKFYEVTVTKREHEQQRDIYIRRAERARIELEAMENLEDQRLTVQQSIDAKITSLTRMSLTYLLRQIRAYEYAFVTDYPLDLGDLKASRKTGSQFYAFIQEHQANLAVAETAEASYYNHCGGQCLSWTQHDISAGSAERDLFVQSGQLTVDIPLPKRTSFFAVRWIDVRVFLVGLNDPQVDLDIWQAGTSEMKGRDGVVRRYTHGAQATSNGWTTPAYGFTYDGTSCAPRNSVSGLSDFSCQADGDSMYVRYSPYSTWTIQVLNHDQKPLELVTAVRFEFNLGEHHGEFDGERIFFDDDEGARGCEGMHSSWDTFSTAESCVARTCAAVTSNPAGYSVANLGQSTLGALGEVACADTHSGRAVVSECAEEGSDFSFSGCTMIITGRCSGNYNRTEDTVCGAGYSAVPNSGSTEADGNHATCCNRVFCPPQYCPEGFVLRPSATTTLPAAGTPTSLSACCISVGDHSNSGQTFAGMCVGNTDGAAEPDVVCSSPAQLRTNAATVVGRDENACCIVQGMCTDNGDGDTEQDIVCTAPARLKNNPATVVGRDQATCCITTGMCTGNSDTGDDTTCGGGMVLIAGASGVVGTGTSECCEPLDACATLECITPPPDSCLSGGLCRGGACQPLVTVPDGTPCDDLDSETMTDECHGLVCAGRVSLASTLTFGIDAAEIPLPGSEERAALNDNVKAALLVSLQAAGMTSVSADSISIVSIRLGSVIIDFSVAVPAAEASPLLRAAAAEQIASSTATVVIGGQTAQLSAAEVEPFKSYAWVKTEPAACDGVCGMIDDSYLCFEDGTTERSGYCEPTLGAQPYTQTECPCSPPTILATAAPAPEPTEDPMEDLMEMAPAAGAGAGVLGCIVCVACLVCSACKKKKKKASLPTTDGYAYGTPDRGSDTNSGVFSEQMLHEETRAQQQWQQQMQQQQQQRQIEQQQKQLEEQQRKIRELAQVRDMRSRVAQQMAQPPTLSLQGNSSYGPPSPPSGQGSSPGKQRPLTGLATGPPSIGGEHEPAAQFQRSQSTAGFQLEPEPQLVPQPQSDKAPAPADPEQIAVVVGAEASLEQELVAAGIPAAAAAAYFAKLAEEGYDSLQLFNELSIDELRDDFGFKRGHAVAVQKTRAQQP